MGGYGAVRNGIVYSDTFSHIGGFSSAVHHFEKDDKERFMVESLFADLDKAKKTNVNPGIAFEELINEKRYTVNRGEPTMTEMAYPGLTVLR